MEEALIAMVTISGALLELQIRRDLWVCCSIKAIQEMRRRAPNIRMASSTFNTILNPRREHSRISVWQKAVEVVVRLEVLVPLAMALRMVGRDHSDPTSMRNPWEVYS